MRDTPAGKTVMVTGASSGLGMECVRRFAGSGWSVVACMRRPQEDPELPGALNVHYEAIDVAEQASVTRAVQGGLARFDRIDAVVNAAGYGLRGIFEAIPVGEIHRQFDVNLFGIMNVCRAILPHFRNLHSGVIVNISSAAGLVGLPLSSIYAASKFALEGFSEALSYELSSQGIIVKIVEPGGMSGTRFAANAERASSCARDIPDYANFLTRAQGIYRSMARMPCATAADVASVVFGAVTDGTDQLRYVATEDIRPLVRLRQETSESEYISTMRRRLRMPSS